MHCLCLDIGSGTQDVLFSLEGESRENWPKFVLPSPARRVADRVRRLAEKGSSIYLHGGNMGGGFKGALMEHLRMGGNVAAHPEAAAALSDSEDKVRRMGVILREARPEGYVPVKLADFEPGFWDAFWSMLDLPAPDLVLAAVQDHGYHPESSNRLGRFEIWRRLLSRSRGRPEAFLFRDPPQELTRLRSLHRAIGQGVVADTGTAAVLGALSVPDVERASRQGGACVVNAGNSHVIAFLVLEGAIRGIYEHHTGLMDPQSLWRDLELFRRGGLSGEEVFRNEGHGCCYLEEPEHAGDFGSVYVLGPNRDMLAGYPVTFPAPGGDMMLAGCFGLLHGLRLLQGS
jgi:uncharacterized protein (DUF1786 family)